MNKRIWLSPPHLTGEEQKYLNEVFEKNWVAPVGANLTKFEDELAAYLHTSKELVALNSGTAAIHLALKLAGVQKGDHVLCQDFTYVASVNPIIYCVAHPILIDSERDTWNMCPELLEEAIQSELANGVKPAAILVVHGYGMPAKIKEISALGKEYGIPIIEDAASALGSEVDHKKCGLFGDFGIVSFNGNKIITTSGGGALICDTEALKEKAIFYATQARETAAHYQHAEIGYNYRLSNVLAGIGRGQLEVLENRIAKRIVNYNFYKTSLSKLQEISFLDEPLGVFSNRWLTCILTSSFEAREKIRVLLEENNIESRPLWKPMSMQPLYRNSKSYLNGVSEDLFKRGLCLPSGSNLATEDLSRVVAIVKSCF